jgi:GcrA cell cycle regulator
VAKQAPSLPPAPRKIEKPAAQEQRLRVPLIALKANECRWPLGDPRDEDFGFCGSGSIPGLPYCAEHAKVAYQAATRNRILKAEDFDSEVSAEDVEKVRAAVQKK